MSASGLSLTHEKLCRLTAAADVLRGPFRRHTERVMAKLGVVARAEVGPRLWASSRRGG